MNESFPEGLQNYQEINQAEVPIPGSVIKIPVGVMEDGTKVPLSDEHILASYARPARLDAAPQDEPERKQPQPRQKPEKPKPDAKKPAKPDRGKKAGEKPAARAGARAGAERGHRQAPAGEEHAGPGNGNNGENRQRGGNGNEEPGQQPGNEGPPGDPEAVGGRERAAIDPDRLIRVQYNYSHLVENRLRQVGGVNTLEQLRERNPLMAEQLEASARFEALGEHFHGLFGEEEIPRRLYEDANHLLQISPETLSQLQLRPQGEQAQPAEEEPTVAAVAPVPAEAERTYATPPPGPHRRWWQIWRRTSEENEPPRNRFVSRGLGIIALLAAAGTLAYVGEEVIDHEQGEGHTAAAYQNGRPSKGLIEYLRQHGLTVRQSTSNGGSNVIVTGSHDTITMNGGDEASEAAEHEDGQTHNNGSKGSEENGEGHEEGAEGAEFNVEYKHGLEQEIQEWYRANGFEVPSGPQVHMLYLNLRDKFGTHLIDSIGKSPDTYIREQGDVGISNPGPAIWPDNVEDFLRQRGAPAG